MVGTAAGLPSMTREVDVVGVALSRNHRGVHLDAHRTPFRKDA
jgi:hypothetical protein